MNLCLDPDPAKRPSAKDLVDFLVGLEPGTVPSKGAVPAPAKPVPAKDGRPSQEALDTAGPSTGDAPAPAAVETPEDAVAKESKDDGLQYFRSSMSPFSMG